MRKVERLELRAGRRLTAADLVQVTGGIRYGGYDNGYPYGLDYGSLMWFGLSDDAYQWAHGAGGEQRLGNDGIYVWDPPSWTSDPTPSDWEGLP